MGLLSFLKKRSPMTPQEEFVKVLNTVFEDLKAADGLTGIEQLVKYVSSLGVLVSVVKEFRPDVPIEDDGPAMVLLNVASKKESWDSVASDMDFMAKQVRECPKDPLNRSILVRSFLAPRYVSEVIARAEHEHSSKPDH